ncbi:MAG: hypothetical protein U9Q81_06355 [Pseudomonadota bacterium]|nr:hypothetical protein [Pseudomonadota bacterium]
MKTILSASLLSLWLVSSFGLAAESEDAESAPDTEIRGAVSAFHTHIEPVWHHHYPAKDAAAIKEEIPALKDAAEAVLSATKADGSPASQEAAEKLVESVDALSAASAAQDEGAVMVSVEQMHDEFHELITTLKVSQKELH